MFKAQKESLGMLLQVIVAHLARIFILSYKLAQRRPSAQNMNFPEPL